MRRFIADELLDEPLGERDPLAEELLDSLGIEQLISYLEETFELRFDDGDLVLENFASLDVLTAFVDSRRAACA